MPRKAQREEDEEKYTDYYHPSLSTCPSCNQEYDEVLILPCSHTMCGHCVATGERRSSGQPLHRLSVSLPVCSVLCPSCRRPVELPCRTWSSATSCLPKHPSVRRAHISGEIQSEEEPSEDHFQLVEQPPRCRESTEGSSHSCLHESNAATSPVDGAIDLQEEDMARSVSGLRFALDSSSLPTSLRLSSSSLTVTYRRPQGNKVQRSKTTSGLELPQVRGDVVIARGQYYWEVEVCNSSMYRIGVTSRDGCCGWWLERQGRSFWVVYDGTSEPICTVPPQIKSLGVFLNIGGGALSFHNPVTHEHLATLPTRFSATGVRPALGLGQGCLRLRCCLPPPPHIFLSKDSTYKGPCVTGGSQWRRDIPFKSVRRVIQTFEQLAVVESDSGVMSSFRSSSSNLSSPPDLGRTTGQEAAAE
ncbi:cardiomyopathy-associated 5-like isoform X1 [Solea senegalensis]|uniref:Cardiomyopathy-associated 5-like isoform X1 n=1 Tax=Solea senegalensis TaxID=28829 RepID=A0AAV6PVX1_SOLSE|nr:uncharacterized protein LOC122774016 [Solea senegalensis]KAG7478720.1 cardiomyopathy-associated 5-like isoform X1 [Solea senegalensis]